MTRKVEVAALSALLGVAMVLLVSPAKVLADPADSQHSIKLDKVRLLEKQAALARDEAAVWRQLAELRQRQADLLTERAKLIAREARLSHPGLADGEGAEKPDESDSARSAPEFVPAAEPKDMADALAGQDDAEEEDDTPRPDEGGMRSEELRAPFEVENIQGKTPSPDLAPMPAAEPTQPDSIDTGVDDSSPPQEEAPEAASASGSILRATMRTSAEEVMRLIGWVTQLRVELSASPAPIAIVDPLPTTAIAIQSGEAGGEPGIPSPASDRIDPAQGNEGQQEQSLSSPELAPGPCIEPTQPDGVDQRADVSFVPEESTPKPAPEVSPSVSEMPRISSQDVARAVSWVKKLGAELIERWRASPTSPVIERLLGQS